MGRERIGDWQRFRPEQGYRVLWVCPSQWVQGHVRSLCVRNCKARDVPFAPAATLSSRVFSSRAAMAEAGGFVPTGDVASVSASFFSSVLMSIPLALASSTEI